MPITLQCPNPACGVTSPASDAVNGRTVRCKKCGTPFTAKPTMDGQKFDTKKSHPSSSSNPFPALPAEFGRYRILRLLGRGGMGAVYLAEDTTLGRQVALKMPFFDASVSPQRVERFIREARSAAALSHPNICTVYDAGEIDGRPFLTMAYIAGKPLEDVIDPDAPMPQPRAAEVARKVALALEHAHAKGIVHRDLKPANVMLTAEGEPVVMDFGLAKRFAESDAQENKLTREGGVLGTPSYMAPEQVRGELAAIGPATDVYALGVLLFEMLVGRTPYHGPLGVVMLQIQTAPTPPVKEFRPDVDARLDAVCQKAMAKAPADRFPSMADFADAIWGYLTEPNAPPPVAAVVKAPTTAANPAWLEELEVVPRVVPALKKVKREPGAKALPLWKQWQILAGAAASLILAGVVVLWAAGVFRLKTQDGVIVVDSLPADAEVFVDGEKVALKLSGDDQPIEIQTAPGKRKLEIKTAGFKMVTREVTLAAGEHKPIGIRLEPLPVASKTPAPVPLASETPPPVPQKTPRTLDPDRQAAEYVLSIGGRISVNDEEGGFSDLIHLPRGMFRLTSVDLLGNTRVTDEGLSCFDGCTNVKVLNLGQTKVGDEGLEHFRNCKNLTSLSLSVTKTTDAGLVHFKDCEDLRFLNLDYLPIGDEGLANLKGCKKLETVGLNGTRITDAGLGVFQGCTRLLSLNLYGDQVGDLGLAYLSDSQSLKALELGQTQVSDLAPLKGMSLTRLNCGRTKVVDLAPLKGMPLKDLVCDFKAERDSDILRSIKTLEKINEKPAAEFWKEVDAAKPPEKSPPETNSETAPEDDKGFTPLFNGKDLRGWKVHPSQPGDWHVVKGVLTVSANKPTHLYTNRA